MQDTLSHVVKSVSLWANSAREAGATEEQLHAANVWTLRAVFSTLTNVNFSEERIAEYIQEGMVIKKDLEKLSAASKPVGPVAETPLFGKSLQELEEFGHSVSIPKRLSAMGDEDCFSLNEIATYGARGTFECLRLVVIIGRTLLMMRIRNNLPHGLKTRNFQELVHMLPTVIRWERWTTASWRIYIKCFASWQAMSQIWKGF